MNNNIETEDQKKETILIKENYEDEYWSQKYGVSAEELKKPGNNHDGLPARIIAAVFKKKKSYSL